MGLAAKENTRPTLKGHIHIAPMFKRYLRPMYDRTLTGGKLWNEAEYMHEVGAGDGQERLWCLAIFRSPFLVGQQQLKPDKHMQKHTSVHMNAYTHARTNFTLTWNSVVLRMWRPSGLQREESSPIEPSSILQCQSGCSRDHTWRTESDRRTAISQRWWHPSLNLISSSEKHLSIRNHERLALDTLSKVSYLRCDAHETDIWRTCFHHCSSLKVLQALLRRMQV